MPSRQRARVHMDRGERQMVEVGGHCIRPSAAETSVIFIHGILSDGEKAWTNANGTSWPELLAKEAWPDFSIYNFSYRSDVFSRNYSLADVVASLREFFTLEGLWEKARIIFVCHSMGGIIARKFIVSYQARLIEHQINIGLFLVASPSIGSKDANAFILRLLRNAQADALRFSQSNVWLNELDQEFVSLKESRRINLSGKELVEDESIRLKKWLGLYTQVVEPFAAARYFDEPIKIPYSDHISISKPVDSCQIQHRLLLHFINEIVRHRHELEPRPVDDCDLEETRKAFSAIDERLSSEKPIPRDALVAFNHALIETRRYIKKQHVSGKRDEDIEQQLSALWTDASNALWEYDREFASRCMIKGNGWADETVWDDPRYRDLPLKLNDMLAKARHLGGDAARDIVEGECEIDTVTWRKRVMLPPFKSPPEITLSADGTEAREEPKIESLTADQFTIVISNSRQAGKWAWRARGTLLN